jgi:hypothetical protein
MNRSVLIQPLAIAVVLVAGTALAQPPVRSFSKGAFAGQPRVIKASHAVENPPPGIEQVALPSSYWEATPSGGGTWTRETRGGVPAFHEVNHLPQRASLQRAVLAPLESKRMRVTVSLAEKQLWISKGERQMSVALEFRGSQPPTRQHLEQFWKAGQATFNKQAQRWRLPEALILDFEKNAYSYRVDGLEYPLKLDDTQDSFQVMHTPSVITEKLEGLLHMASR